MKSIFEIDPNFAARLPSREDLVFHSARRFPFAVRGVFWEDGRFRRLPERVAAATSEGVAELHANTAGGRVCFCTDSPYIVLRAAMDRVGKMPHFALTGSAGFDLYEGSVYRGTFVPPFDLTDGYEAAVEVGEGGLREYTVNFPLYSDVSEVEIGLAAGAVLTEPAPCRGSGPIVYYGSSITQGGCASRPGRSYQSVIARQTGYDYVNLGFSGSARGEEVMARYIAGLDMAAFVLDYDHNAPTAEHLAATHEPFFRTVRAAHPEAPIVLLSRPRAVLTAEEEERLAIVRATWERARAAGDENVWFLSGSELMAHCGNEGSVDGCHPTDFGFASMAAVLGALLEKILP